MTPEIAQAIAQTIGVLLILGGIVAFIMLFVIVRKLEAIRLELERLRKKE